VDAARVARRLGAEEAVMIYRSDRQHMKAHPSEAMEAFAEGVKVMWMSTVKQFGSDGITVEEMQLLPDGSGSVGTGRYEQLRTDSLVLAVGEHADVEFLKALPGIRIGRGDVVEVDNQMGIGQAGIFAGGDMIGGARTMTTAVGHGKKAARNIDAWLRGAVFDKPPKHAVVPFEALNLPVFLDAERRQQGEIPVDKRKGFEEVMAGLSESEARYEARRCLSCGNCFECDNCYASCPEQAIVKLGAGRFYRYDYDLCTGCAVCFEQCPCHAIEMRPEPAGAATPPAESRETTMPARFKVRP
jgi:Pyruvate/2-oxoacid:ferredoxin oxidoreductase delta subunit